MARMLFTPRWLGRLGLLLLVVAACVTLGRWQWDVAHTTVVRTPPPGTTSLTEAHAVGRPVGTDQAGQRVWLRGTFDADRQVLVVDRPRDGVAGSWVVTAMRVDGAEPAGAVVPVVRGWLPEGESPPDPPRGRQRVEGWLEPSEPDTVRAPDRGVLATGEVELISSPELLSLWQPPLYQGFVIQDSPDPAAPLVPVPRPPDVSSTTDWQNFAYAIQWWLFALFAIFWFVRMMRVEAEDSADVPSTGSPEGLDGRPSLDRMDETTDHTVDDSGTGVEREQREHQ